MHRFLILPALLAFAGVLSAADAAPAKKPNILVIFGDDIGFEEAYFDGENGTEVVAVAIQMFATL